VYGFPVVGGHHLDRVPRAAIEKRAIGTFARTLLAADAEVRIDFDSPKRRMVFIRHPEHAGFNRTILDTRWRAGASGAAVGGNREDARPLLPRGFAVALGHWPVLVYDVVHPLLSLTFAVVESCFDSNIALRNSSTICVNHV
jgi:hypothetical protein